jgi:Protein tyrosine and serine/threonine kinase
MAPEQLRGETLDARADVFAFGVMACELATGAHPFGGNDPAALVERMVSDALIVSTHLTTSGLDAVVRRCLQGSRENRYANGGELSAALRAAIAGAPAAPSAAAKMTLWWWQFHQVAVALLCGAVLIPMWLSRPWNSWGSAAFLATLVLVTISTALRLHLWFVSHVHQSGFPIQRARLLPWIVAIEALLVVLLTAVAIALSGRHDPVAAWFVVTALLLVVSIVVIEPATTRAALA